ncbi:hypothetical protein PRIPAC_94634, partial [Pristionchus pacificus]
DFDFYVVTEFTTESGFIPCGYFSRKRLTILDTNLNCFCVFPCYQNKGLGRFLIDFSYQLSIISGIPGGPERPFSDAGLLAYSSYWKRTVSIALAKVREIDVEGLVRRLGMKADDIVEVIQNLFSTTTKNDELVINEQILKSIAAKEKEKDKSKLYPKMACFEQGFVKSIKAHKKIIEA